MAVMSDDSATMLEQNLERLQRECSAIDEELDQLIAEGRAGTEQEREEQNRRFIALAERRRAAARRMMECDDARLRARWSTAH